MIAPAATAAAGTAASLPGFGQTLLSLVVVLASIFVLAAGLRRLQGVRRGSGSSLRVSETLQIGPKERLLLIEAAGAHLLVGVGGNGQMQTLHVYDGKPAAIAPAVTSSVSAAEPATKMPLGVAFSEVLKRSLGRGAA